MQKTPSSITRPLRGTLIIVSVMLLFVGSGSVLVRWYVLPQRMQTLLHEAPASQISPRMDYLLKNAPLPHETLAQLLASPRTEISSEAAQRLDLLLKEWEQRPGNEIADQAVVLAQELGRQFAACSPSVQQRISRMANRMARWQLGHSPADQAKFLMAIEELAKAASHPAGPAPSAANDTMLSQYLESAPSHRTANAIAPPVDASLAMDLSAGTPWETVDLPRVLPAEAEALPPRPSAASAEDTQPPVRNRPLEANQPLAVAPPATLPRLLHQPLPLDAVHHESDTPIAFDKLTTWEVIWRLHEGNKEQMAQAEAELVRRRFTPTDLLLARRISAPELTTRLQVVRELPMMSRNDITTWLYYMTKDPDETVRYAAAAALLTTADPRIHRQLRSDLATDPSVRVRELFRR